MSTKTKNAPSGIDPHRLFTYAELAEATGLNEYLIRNMVSDGRLEFVAIGSERGKRVAGYQYLAWLEDNSRRYEPEA
jgi:hypothetical protein